MAPVHSKVIKPSYDEEIIKAALTAIASGMIVSDAAEQFGVSLHDLCLILGSSCKVTACPQCQDTLQSIRTTIEAVIRVQHTNTTATKSNVRPFKAQDDEFTDSCVNFRRRRTAYTEENMRDAVAAVSQGMTMRVVAKIYAIPLSSLFDRLSKRTIDSNVISNYMDSSISDTNYANEISWDTSQDVKKCIIPVKSVKKRNTDRRIYFRMRKSKYTEEYMNAAISAVSHGMGKRQASREFCVPVSSLCDRINERKDNMVRVCRRYTELSMKNAISDVLNGMTMSGAAKKNGIPQSSLFYHMKGLGRVTTNVRPSSENTAEKETTETIEEKDCNRKYNTKTHCYPDQKFSYNILRKKTYSEQNMRDAISEVVSGSNISQAALKYGIPQHSLRYRIKKSSKYPENIRSSIRKIKMKYSSSAKYSLSKASMFNKTKEFVHRHLYVDETPATAKCYQVSDTQTVEAHDDESAVNGRETGYSLQQHSSDRFVQAAKSRPIDHSDAPVSSLLEETSCGYSDILSREEETTLVR